MLTPGGTQFVGQNPLMGQALFEEAMRRRRRRLRLRLLTKGQEITEENCGVFNVSKKTNENTSLISVLPSKKSLNQKMKELYYVK